MDASTASAAELEAAERVVMRWDSTASLSSEGGEEQMLFAGGGDRAEADRFLRAVDDLRRLAPASSAAVQAAMSRLEDEFRHVLSARALDHETEALAFFRSHSAPTSLDRKVSDVSDGAGDEDDDDSSVPSYPYVARLSSYGPHPQRSVGVAAADLFPEDAVGDLRAIASRMAAAGYGGECVRAYASVREAAVGSALRRLGVQTALGAEDVQLLEWDALEAAMRRWTRAARAAVRGVFASERRLCFLVFHDAPPPDSDTADRAFAEAVKGAAQQLLGFAEAVGTGRCSPERLFKIIDMHDALGDLLPDIAAVFAASEATESIYAQAARARSSLGDAVRGILSKFESAVRRDPSKVPVPGGTVHPLTRYVMNYGNLISDYKGSISELITTGPSPCSLQIAADGDEPTPAFPDLALPDPGSQLPLAAHLVWIIVALEHNLESKASLYKDAALPHLFLMNNVRYIVHKIKASAEFRGLIGDGYLKRLTRKFRQAAITYQRSGWLKILNCLKHEGIRVRSGFSSGICKMVLRERFKGFNAGFGEAHKSQSGWYVPDTRLREELRISVWEKLLLAYQPFLGKFRHHVENGKRAKFYIKYSVEDLEEAMEDFFEGASPSTRKTLFGKGGFGSKSLGFTTKLKYILKSFYTAFLQDEEIPWTKMA